MEIFRMIINDYGMTILYAIGTAIFGALGVFVKNQYRKIANNKEKAAVISTCVKAVEQLYQNLGGAEKLEKVKENTVAMLNAKGIEIAEIEMDMLIEACVLEFNLPFLEAAKAARTAAAEHMTETEYPPETEHPPDNPLASNDADTESSCPENSSPKLKTILGFRAE